MNINWSRNIRRELLYITDSGKWYVIETLNCDVSRSTRFAINARARTSGTIEVNCSIVTAINYTRP